MKPQDGLFESVSERAVDATADLYRQEGFRTVARDIVSAAREHGQVVSMPGLAHIRYALNRQLTAMGTGEAFPKGRVYVLPEHDSFILGDTKEDGDSGITYVSRIIVATGDETGSKAASFFSRLIDEAMEEQPNRSGTTVLIHSLTPKDTAKIYSPRTITFLMLQSKSGENYFFTVQPNANKGKVIAEQATADESDTIREKIGYIDGVAYEAVSCDLLTIHHIEQELQAAKRAVATLGKKENQDSATNTYKMKVIGQRALSILPFIKNKQAT